MRALVALRLLDPEGTHLDKQPFREEAPIDDVAKTYVKIGKRISQFASIDPESLKLYVDDRMLIEGQRLNSETSPTIMLDW